MRSLLAGMLMVGLVSGMTARAEMTAEEAGEFMGLALAGIDREFPNKPGQIMRSAEDARTPREMYPVFYGHFDWHSSVHGHWTLVRLLKMFPDHPKAAEVRKVLEARMTEEGLEAEAGNLVNNPTFERMYGWAWALRLGLELRTWDDDQGREWSRRFRPVETVVVSHAKLYLAKLDWPIRCGFHPESAFPLAQMLDYARGTGEVAFEQLLVIKARGYYESDINYPLRFEPSGNDFFSAGMNEADLMRRVLSEKNFGKWLDGFFPGLKDGEMGNLRKPVSVAHLDDGHLVHLVGLNLTRAWTMRSVADHLPEGDVRRETLLAAAAEHEKAGMRQVFSGSYEGEHWLGSFAVYLKTGVGRSAE